MGTLIASALFGLVVIVIGIWGYRLSAKTAEDYFVVSRALGIFVMFFFIFFGVVSSWTFLLYPGTMYVEGPGFTYFGWSIILGYVALLIFIAPRMWAATRQNRFLSPIEAIGDRFESPALRLMLSVTLILFLIPYIGVQPFGVGGALEALTGIQTIEIGGAEVPFKLVGALYIIAMMLFTVLMGGMRAVAWVNVILGLIYIISDCGSLIWAVVHNLPGGLVEAAQKVSEFNPDLLGVPGPPVPGFPGGKYGPMFVLGTGLCGAFCFSFPHINIGLMACRSKAVFKWLAILFLVCGGTIYVIPALWSLVAPGVLPDLSPKMANFVVMIIVNKTLPHWFAVFFFFGVVSATLSTVALQLMGAGILLSRDVIFGSLKREVTDRQLVLWTRIGMIFIVLASFVATMMFKGQAASAVVFAASGMFQLVPPLVFGFLWKRATKAGAIAGLVCGLCYQIAGFFIPALFGFMWTAPAVLVNAAVLVVVSLFTEPNSEETITKFFDEVEEYLESCD